MPGSVLLRHEERMVPNILVVLGQLILHHLLLVIHLSVLLSLAKAHVRRNGKGRLLFLRHLFGGLSRQSGLFGHGWLTNNLLLLLGVIQFFGVRLTGITRL